MKQARSNLALVTLGARVYAVGGFDGKQRLRSVEVLRFIFIFIFILFSCNLALVTLLGVCELAAVTARIFIHLFAARSGG